VQIFIANSTSLISQPNPLYSFGSLFRGFIHDRDTKPPATVQANSRVENAVSPAILAQLATFLHSSCRPETASALFSANSGNYTDSTTLRTLHQHFDPPGDTRSKSLLLLVSGSTASADAITNQVDHEILCGIYLPIADTVARRHDFGAVFQLRPLHRALPATNMGEIRLLTQDHSMTSPSLVFQVCAPPHSSSGQERNGFLKISSADGPWGELVFPSAPPLEFHINDISLFGVEPVIDRFPPQPCRAIKATKPGFQLFPLLKHFM
jgi:hypothetical protein